MERDHTKNSLYLNKYVGYCFIDKVCIFLNIRKDIYKYLDSRYTREIKEIQKTSEKNLACQNLNRSEKAINCINELISQDFLTFNENVGKDFVSPIKMTAYSSVYDAYWERNLDFKSIITLLLTFVRVKNYLRRDSFFETLKKADSIKMNTLSKKTNLDKDFIIKKARQYIDARSLIYSYFDKCFLDSYILFTLFNRRSISVDWVFGVELYPFRAHCWIEYEGIVLNDNLERVSACTPIYRI